MSESKARFHCLCCCHCCHCCCDCCQPRNLDKEDILTIEAYQPVVPTEVVFDYPQRHSVEPLGNSPPTGKGVVSSQPTSRGPLPPSHGPSHEPSHVHESSTWEGEAAEQPLLSEHDRSANTTPASTPISIPTSTPVSAPSPITGPSMTPLPGPSVSHGTLEFNLYFDARTQSLCVHIHRGLYFPLKKGAKSVNSYVKAILFPSKKSLSTRIIWNSRSPTFDQLLAFSGPSLMEYKEQELILHVLYREDGGKDRHAACCFTKLSEIDLTESNQLTERINEKVDLGVLVRMHNQGCRNRGGHGGHSPFKI